MQVGIRVKHQDLVESVGEVLAKEEVPAPVRAVEAEVMAEADLMGVPSHGVRMLPGLVTALREGRVRKDPKLELLRDRAATCVVDCDRGPGRYVSVQGVRYAVERAKRFGVGVCLAAQTSHWGRAHAYALRMAEAGMIGICTTNSMSSMFVQGSAHSVLGNNPLAIAVPRSPGHHPIVLDMAMTQAAVGKIGTCLREGMEVPIGWGLDSSGNPTQNPAAILSSRKFLPMGGHKGYGLCLMMELLTAALAGGLLSFELAQSDRSTLDPGSSKLFVALDIEAFVERGRFLERVEELLRALRSDMEPGQDLLYPGERGWRTRDEYLAAGIPIHPEIVSQLLAIGMPL